MACSNEVVSPPTKADSVLSSKIKEVYNSPLKSALLYIDDPKNFKHEINGNTIRSSDLHTPEGRLLENRFKTKVKPIKWTLTEMYRETKSVPYYTNDVIAYHVKKISEENGFRALPETIKLREVINPGALCETYDKSGSELSEGLFKSDVGKTVLRIMEDHSLVANQVKSRVNPDDDRAVDFYIDVKKRQE